MSEEQTNPSLILDILQVIIARAEFIEVQDGQKYRKLSDPELPLKKAVRCVRNLIDQEVAARNGD